MKLDDKKDQAWLMATLSSKRTKINTDVQKLIYYSETEI